MPREPYDPEEELTDEEVAAQDAVRSVAWADSNNSDPRADLEAVFGQYEASDAPAFLKSTMRRFRTDLLGEDPVEIGDQ